MNNDSAIIDYEAESKSAQLLTDDTQNTDFTQVACCAFGKKPEDPGNREVRAALIQENIEMEEDRPFSLKHTISRMLGLK